MPKQPSPKAPIDPRDLWAKWAPRVLFTIGVAIILFEVLLDRKNELAYGAGLTFIFGGAGVRFIDAGLRWQERPGPDGEG